MPRRNANAPRLIDWTGERFVPWTTDVQVAYEHVHRYLWARELASDLQVLDVGCGEGYGSALLADVAAAVTAIDIDETTVRHARFNYASETTAFAVDDANTLSTIADGSFDLVVAFEVIEHVEEPGRVLDACRRVLRPGGLLVVSTPNRALYSELTQQDNPFHLRELDDAEFRRAVTDRFTHAAFRSQRAQSGSRIDTMDTVSGTPEESVFRVEYLGEVWQEVDSPPPFYMLAVASDSPLPVLPDGSSLVDYSLALVHQSMRNIGEDAGQQVNAALEASAAATARAETEQARAEAAHHDLAHVRQDLAAAHVSLAETVGRLQAEVARRGALDADILGELAFRRQQVASINESISWKVLQRGRRWLRGPGERPALRARVVSLSLRGGRRVLRGPVTTPAMPADEDVADERRREFRERGDLIHLASHSSPTASVVIPTYANADLLARCLSAIATAPISTPFEVLVIDDGDDPDTGALLGAVHGVRVLKNSTNLGYLRSVNRAASEARGSFLVLLNDDTEPRAGWLDHLARRLDQPGVGAAGAKLVYPDGRLQEAGGIVWSDGSGWNYGKGASPDAPAFRYARPVDYCSAACLAVRTDLWERIGGFDEKYGPGYYEDTHLCFAVRDLGAEVWYEPRAVVTHHEGASHGSDVTEGVKRNQVINHGTFVEHWAARIAEQHPPDSPESPREAADRRSGPHVVVVDHMVPEPDRDSGSVRMFAVLRLLSELGARVAFVPDNSLATPGYAEELESLGIEVLDHHCDLRAELQSRGAKCPLVVLSRPTVAARFLPSVREYLPNAQVVFDTVDLHHLREAQRSVVAGVPASVAAAYEVLEYALVDGTDITFAVTAEERRHLIAARPDADVRVLPNVHEGRSGAVPSRDGRAGFVFVGGFRHLPNVAAALRLGGSIARLAAQRGSTERISIVGPDAPPEIMGLAGPMVKVEGWIPEVEPLLDRSIAAVVPLTMGAGMKGKVSQALAMGLPVITTPTGAEGLDLVHERDALIAVGDEEFAAAMLRIATDDELWAALSARGPEIVRERCSPAVVRAELARLLPGS